MDRKAWVVGMIIWGALVAVVTYLATGSILWAVVGLLGAGIVANAIVGPRFASRSKP